MTLASLSKYWMFTNDYTQNPYPFLEHLRREQPVCKVQTPDGLRAWVVTRWSDVRAALSDDRMSRDITNLYGALSRQAGVEFTPPDELSHHLANSDPPRHTPLRKAIVHAFTPRRVEAMRPRITEVVDGLLDTMTASARQDVVTGIAEPLPIITIAHLMGVPDTDWAKFRRWSATLRGVDPTDPTGVLDKDIKALSDYMAALITRLHRTPGDDLMSALIHADPERRLTDTEILSTGFALMTGGNDTTMNLLSGAIAALLGHPEQLAVLRANPQLMRSAVDELLRFTAPAINALQRLTLAPVELGGVTIPEGEIVILSLASANRDPEATPEHPDALDLTRRKPAHVSFGHGIHFCLGAHLARAQTEIAIDRLFTRFPNTRMLVDYADLRYQPGMAVRPLVSVPVKLA